MSISAKISCGIDVVYLLETHSKIQCLGVDSHFEQLQLSIQGDWGEGYGKERF